MQGRITGDQERLIILAHQIEVMARQKTLRAVKHYLEPEKKTPENGAAKVLAMFNRLAKKENANGK